MLIIAEIGINHLGDINLAKKLIDAAVYAGANAVKFQTFWDIYHLRQYEFTKEQWVDLKKYCDKKEILFLSTPHTFEAIHFINKLVPIHKIASTYLGLPNFLMEVADKRKPILLSTGSLVHNDGMATLEEVKCALSYIPNADVTLMHCVSKYPCQDIHLDRLVEMQSLGKKIGLSDHSKSIDISLRLPVLEKHLMLEGITCPDESVSLLPSEFKKMVERIRWDE
jgi:sialic acid synthase SpsE